MESSALRGAAPGAVQGSADADYRRYPQPSAAALCRLGDPPRAGSALAPCLPGLADGQGPCAGMDPGPM